MSTDLEHALRRALRDAAETVVPRPDPMRRLLQRRRRRWAGLGAFFAAIAVAAGAALIPALQAGPAQRADGGDGYRITPWARTLLDSPTRGSLAGTPLLAEVERGIGDRAGGSGLDRVKVLFLGDVAGRRFVAYARFDDTRAALYFNDTAAGDSVARLVTGGSGDLPLTPLVRITGSATPALVGLAPTDCRIATSATGTVSGNGVVAREWTDSPQGSWVARDSSRPAERWRVTCGSTVRFEGPAVPVDEVALGTDLVAAGGLVHGAVVQRWGGSIDGLNWTLTTTLLSGGGIAAVLTSGAGAGVGRAAVATGFPPPVAGSATADRDGWALISTAVSADPDVIAIRVPQRTGAFTYYSERVLVVATATGAWSVSAPASPGSTETALDNGVKVISTDGGPVRITNVEGVDLGGAYVARERDAPELLGEKLVSDW
ncbi:hypothetical protein Daura_07225 [Dactylosporangium aurantiacum]|uniref:Uncharacterized protein n=1 Tax=Dactylosporangium aurantiacum TaxID=35754 RepID=A0A9Q9MKQ6_9ACTN|nr:hypothetical protein [Dactylosporangium aurantiacum]MDG6105973.1 hypothetical protein [Dactylosporangium aurantiacum]UWZ55976.1 hypothetical protein Daura_07225 [Dactylosporangium aurantiacum]